MPLSGKLIVALLTLFLVGLLIRTIRGIPFDGRSIAVAVVATVAGVVALELVTKFYAGVLQDRGTFAAGVGVICGAVLLRPVRPGATRRSASDTVRLSALAFSSGPALGLLLALLTFLLSSGTPADHFHAFAAYMVIGTIAGGIGAIFVAVASASVSGRSSKSDEQE